MLLRFLQLVCLFFLLPHYAYANFADRPEVKVFMTKMVHQHHFTHKELLKFFNQVKAKPVVIRSVKAPLEQKPWYAYQMLFVTEWRIRQGVEFWQQHQADLERAEKMYGVPASIIVATLGVETKYGKNIGEHRVMDALSNLAFSHSPRAPYFRKELEEFLILIREQHLNPLEIMGSYAGAIGQPQFMPSSYRHYAINFSGNAKIDLTHNVTDVIGSIANYYKKHGWKLNQPVTVRAPARYQPFGFLTHAPNTSIARPLSNQTIELQGYYGREYWIGYNNFNVIKAYNPNNLYAMAVYQLSHYISTLKGKTNNV